MFTPDPDLVDGFVPGEKVKESDLAIGGMGRIVGHLSTETYKRVRDSVEAPLKTPANTTSATVVVSRSDLSTLLAVCGAVSDTANKVARKSPRVAESASKKKPAKK